jgi:hypothetical protein
LQKDQFVVRQAHHERKFQVKSIGDPFALSLSKGLRGVLQESQESGVQDSESEVSLSGSCLHHKVNWQGFKEQSPMSDAILLAPVFWLLTPVSLRSA